MNENKERVAKIEFSTKNKFLTKQKKKKEILTQKNRKSFWQKTWIHSPINQKERGDIPVHCVNV